MVAELEEREVDGAGGFGQPQCQHRDVAPFDGGDEQGAATVDVEALLGDEPVDLFVREFEQLFGHCVWDEQKTDFRKLAKVTLGQ